MHRCQTGRCIVRHLTEAQLADLKMIDVPLLAEVVRRVDLHDLRKRTLSNHAAEKKLPQEDENLEVVLHMAQEGDVINWEAHADEVQGVFVFDGQLRVSIKGQGSEDTTLAFVRPGQKHRLEALEVSHYASVYWKVDTA